MRKVRSSADRGCRLIANIFVSKLSSNPKNDVYRSNDQMIMVIPAIYMKVHVYAAFQEEF